MFTLQNARAEAHAKEAARFNAWRHEATRARGVCISGFGPGAYAAKSEAEIEAEARATLSRRQAMEASPAGRFLSAVVAIQRAAIAQGDDALANACEPARSAWSRGLDDNGVAAARALYEMEALGADVTAARLALADVAQGEAA